MVDDIDNPVDRQPEAGWEIAFLLLGGFRGLVDQLHAQLAEQGFPGVRPVHGFALQAIGTGVTATELGVRLGVSKQAAAKTVDGLEKAGFVDRTTDPEDARRKIVVRSCRGDELLTASARAFDLVVDRWRQAAGADRVDELATTLRAVGVHATAKIDLGTWATAVEPDVMT